MKWMNKQQINQLVSGNILNAKYGQNIFSREDLNINLKPGYHSLGQWGLLFKLLKKGITLNADTGQTIELNSDSYRQSYSMKKILLSSDPNGRFDLLIPKVQQLHNKNKFDFMLIVGKVCSSQTSSIFNDIRSKKLSFPLPTYFIDGSDMGYMLGYLYPQGKDIAENLHYLGNFGVKQIEGVNVGFVSGWVKDEIKNLNQKQRLRHQFTKTQARDFIDKNLNNQIDILLTNQWCPQYQPSPPLLCQSDQTISQICYELSPRYHICSSGQKYFRLPAYKGKKSNPTHFINVAEIKQTLPKDKYLVAIQMNPNVGQVIDNLAENILVKAADWDLVGQKKGAGDRGDLSQSEGVGVGEEGKKSGLFSQIKVNKGKRVEDQIKMIDQSSFIMFEGFGEQTPDYQITQFLQKWGQIKQIQVFKKLKGNKKYGIVRFKNIKDAETCLKDSGKYTLYQCRIKFQIKQQNQKYRLKDCFLCIQNQKFDHKLLVHKAKFCYVCVDKGPVSEFHFQIVPINHVSCTADLQIQQQQQISQIRLSYQTYFNKLGYTLICLQRNMKLSAQINHSILHCIPLKHPQSQILLKFNKVNNQSRLNFEPINKVNKGNKNEGQYYIILQINGQKFIRYADAKDKRFQIGRQAICQIIQKPERLNWRDCQIGEDGVRRVVGELRKVDI